MAVRFVDVDVTKVNRGVSPEDLERIAGVERNFGWAGPEFVKSLVESDFHLHPHELRDKVTRAAQGLASEAHDSTFKRAALPFALLLISGEMAKSFGLLPNTTDVAYAVRWAWEQFCQSWESRALRPEEQAIENLQEFVLSRWGSTIHSINRSDADSRSREIEGWYNDDTVYLRSTLIQEACGRILKQRHIGHLLANRDLLTEKEKGRYNVNYVPGVGTVRCYALKRPFFGKAKY